jgi:hypothetical protein
MGVETPFYWPIHRGSQLEIKAVPGSCCEFVSWTINGGTYYLNPFEFTVSTGYTVIANFRTIVCPTSVLVTPSPIPEITPSPIPEITPSPIPEITPSPIPEVTPTVTPEVTPTVTPEVTPTVTPEVTPEVTPSPSGGNETIPISTPVSGGGGYVPPPVVTPINGGNITPTESPVVTIIPTEAPVVTPTPGGNITPSQTPVVTITPSPTVTPVIKAASNYRWLWGLVWLWLGVLTVFILILYLRKRR